MNHRMRENMELAGLAHRRYPTMPLDLAMRCFENDRRHAGLGALDERKRHGRGEIRNRKRTDWQDHGRVTYELTIDRPERRRFPRLPLPQVPWPAPSDMTARSAIQLEIVPAKLDRRCLPIGWDMLDGQANRTALARELRAIRREMRKP